MKRKLSHLGDDSPEQGTPKTICDSSDDESISLEEQSLFDQISKYIIQDNWNAAFSLITMNYVNVNKGNFLEIAIIHGQVAAVDALLKHLEANPNHLNAKGETPLRLSIKHGASFEKTISKSLDSGIAIHNIKNTRTITEHLLLFGANPNYSGDDRKFPIHLAARMGRLSTLKFLAMNTIGTKARLDVIDSFGNNTLHHAAISILENSGEVAAFLIMHGDLNLSATNYSGSTALMLAAKAGNIRFIREILRYFPEVDIKNKNGKTAQELAYENNNNEAAQIIEQYKTLKGEALQTFVYDDKKSLNNQLSHVTSFVSRVKSNHEKKARLFSFP